MPLLFVLSDELGIACFLVGVSLDAAHVFIAVRALYLIADFLNYAFALLVLLVFLWSLHIEVHFIGSVNLNAKHYRRSLLGLENSDF
jgi:hypothetical protein